MFNKPTLETGLLNQSSSLVAALVVTTIHHFVVLLKTNLKLTYGYKNFSEGLPVEQKLVLRCRSGCDQINSPLEAFKVVLKKFTRRS
jgi:hypothetical protein